MAVLERIPDSWDSDRDERFFRITARLLPAAFVAAASALLASYDDERALRPAVVLVPEQPAVPTS